MLVELSLVELTKQKQSNEEIKNKKNEEANSM